MNSVIDIAQELFRKRPGLAGFTFFLVNGLMWLVVPGGDVPDGYRRTVAR